jgi:TPR repeat protein
MYQYGQGVALSDATSVAWYRKAAEGGDAEAQSNLAVMYDTGKGVPHDDAMAMYWYRKAAEQGNAPAEQNLAVGYYKGQGVKLDYQEAYVWSSLAAVHYPASDTESRANALRTRDLAASKLVPDQLTAAQKRVNTWSDRLRHGV